MNREGTVPSRTGSMRRRRATKRIVIGAVGRVALYTAVIGLALIYVLPFIWVISTSLKTDPQVYRIPPSLIPNPVRWANYPDALGMMPWGIYFKNTIVYAALTALGTVLSSSICAYGFSRVTWPGRETVFFLCLATMMIPYQVSMIPLYLIFNKIGWVNSYKPLIVPEFFASAYSIFLFRQFFMSIPQELSDAARIDGSSELGILARIVIPLSRPVIAVVALFRIMSAWDDYMGPLIYLKDDAKFPISLGLQLMRDSASKFYTELLWPRLMAASAVTILPVLVLFFLTQRTFIEGISITGIKG